MSKKDRTRTLPDGTVQHDFIEHGSDEHMEYLGLRKATKDDKVQFKGYAFAYAPYGVEWDEDRELRLLKSKVSGFLTKPPEIQSEDRQAEHYAPPMWSPREPDESPVTGII
jgi:hypothetical protein